MKNKLAAIEGILFSMGTSVTRRQLMEALEIDDEQFDELIKLLRCFGVKSTDDLPVVGEEQVEDFKIQAQEEVKYTLDETNLEEEMEEM